MGVLMRKSVFLIIAIALLYVGSVSAQQMVISNSQDWRDVYSVELYGNLQGLSTMFLTSVRHATIIHFSLPESDIEIISSVDDPFVVGFDNILTGQGIQNVEEFSYDNVNLELARRLDGISDFIIIDDSYGYNALAVASYASMAGYYVLFADDRSIADVVDYLASINVNDLIIFGQVDREVKDALKAYNPEVINTGDRFDNNIEIVKRYLEQKPTEQMILTNGEFIEQSLIDGANPVLFIGKTNVPDQIQKFIKENNIDIGILVGNELIGTATLIRRQIGISVFVKFAQGSRTPGGSISAVEDLDRFPMPSYVLDLQIFSIFYNQATGMLEVTFRNNAELATYFKSTINVFSGEDLVVLGDEEPIFIDGKEYKTVLYKLEQPLQGENSTAELYTIYGESPKSLEFALQATSPIETISVMDESMINVTDLYYDATTNQFVLIVKNIGEVDVYVDAELIDLWINDELITLGGDEVVLIKAGKTGKIRLSVDMSDEDMANARNQQLDIRVLYGQRENALIKVLRTSFEFKMKSFDITIYILILVVLILFFLIFWKRRKKKKEKKEKSGHENSV